MNKSKMAIVIATGLAALALANAQDAHADEASFINGVYAHGVEVNSGTLPVGHQICADVSQNGVAGLETESNYAVTAGVPPHTAAVLIVLAVSELCPSNQPALNAWLSTVRA